MTTKATLRGQRLVKNVLVSYPLLSQLSITRIGLRTTQTKYVMPAFNSDKNTKN